MKEDTHLLNACVAYTAAALLLALLWSCLYFISTQFYILTLLAAGICLAVGYMENCQYLKVQRQKKKSRNALKG